MNTVNNIRVHNVKKLISQYGTQQKFADAIKKSQSQVGQWINNHNPLGEKLARYIENKLSLDNGYLDQDHDNTDLAIDDDVIKVKRYSLKLSAGFGCDIFCEEPEGSEYLNRAYVESCGWKIDSLCVFAVDGDSMLVTLLNGEKVVIDTSRTEPLDNRVFAVAKNGVAWIKRLIFNPNTMNYLVTSDNDSYRRFDFPLDNECKIIGLAVHTLGRKLF